MTFSRPVAFNGPFCMAHLYTDDSPTHVSSWDLSPELQTHTSTMSPLNVIIISDCICLNQTPAHPPATAPPAAPSISVHRNALLSAAQDRSLGVTLDLLFSSHTISNSSGNWFYLQMLSIIWPFNSSSVPTGVQVTVIFSFGLLTSFGAPSSGFALTQNKRQILTMVSKAQYSLLLLSLLLTRFNTLWALVPQVCQAT